MTVPIVSLAAKRHHAFSSAKLTLIVAKLGAHRLHAMQVQHIGGQLRSELVARVAALGDDHRVHPRLVAQGAAEQVARVAVLRDDDANVVVIGIGVAVAVAHSC